MSDGDEQRQPVMAWDSQDPFDGPVVWWSRVDGRFQVEVTRQVEDQEHADLRVYDHDDDNTMIAERDMGHLAYGAIFGPDVDDVAQFQRVALEIIDGYA